MTRTLQRLCGIASTLLLAAPIVCGAAPQETPAAESQTPEAATLAAPTISDVTLGPGDEVVISVWRNPDLGGTYTVGPTGEFFIPLVGSIQTEGVGVTVIRQKITDSLRTYLKDPQVTLTVSHYRSRKVFVLGEVNKPGIFSLGNESMSLVDAISLAGGLTLDGKGKQIFRIPAAAPGSGSGQVEKFDLMSVFKKGNVTENPRLANGDIIYVPPTTIANVDRFFKHFRNIMEPIVWFERAIVLAPIAGDAIQGDRGVTVINGN